MEILLIEPFYSGSHKQWCDGLKKFSSHNIELLTMSGHYWKWRMHGGAITLAKKFLNCNDKPDLMVCSDMLDLTSFLGLTKNITKDIPIAIYFHENQLTYPWSPDDIDVRLNRDNHYAFINFISALAADQVFFNSNYHMQSFFSALPDFLKGFPDHNELSSVQAIERKSKVLPLGMDLKRFDKYQQKSENDIPIILWNHRWEYDKNPEAFFDALTVLQKSNIDFKLVVLGEKFSNSPEMFYKAEKQFADNILHFGYVESFDDYAKWLWKSDILPITSNQDFFGGSVVEAMYCNAFPLLPNRLNYPHLIPDELNRACIYSNLDELVNKLEKLIKTKSFTETNPQKLVTKYDWSELIKGYDEAFSNIRDKKLA